MTADDRLLAQIEDAGFAMLLLREYREALLAMPTLPETAAETLADARSTNEEV